MAHVIKVKYYVRFNSRVTICWVKHTARVLVCDRNCDYNMGYESYDKGEMSPKAR